MNTLFGHGKQRCKSSFLPFFGRQLQAKLQVRNVSLKTDGLYDLFYVENVNKIDDGKDAIIRKETINDLYELSNNVGMKVSVMKRGGNMVQINKNGSDYLWRNKEGACYYGPNSNSFPLQRGLLLHGGVRFAAVTAEHGLYYDSDWDISSIGSSDKNSDEISVVLKISDTVEQRTKIRDPLSYGQFNKSTDPYFNGMERLGYGDSTMTKYPVTNLNFTYTITLRENEEFVRLNMKVENASNEDVNGEAWLPMTYPIEQESQIISPQEYRWRRDEWCFPQLANIVNFNDANNEWLKYPLKWPSSGIFYDWPYMQGGYHAVNRPSTGQGTAYITDKNSRHFIKLWSWGDKDNFDRETSDALAKGRPATEYYEPWGSAFNFAFFQSATFKANTTYQWNAAILPIESGLTDTHNESLQRKVEKEIKKHNIDINSPSDMY